MKIKDTRRNSRRILHVWWLDGRYEYIIELGKKLPLIKEFKTESNLIKAANQSVVARRENDDKVVFTADSDAIWLKELSHFDSYFSNQTAWTFSIPIWFL
jgi:cysteine desulfuration protein SufE